jgi:hypothetical protein
VHWNKKLLKGVDMDVIMLYAKKDYKDLSSEELRGMTLAAFSIAQSSDELSNVPMRVDVLRFRITSSAIYYWKKQKSWLEEHGENDNGEKLLRLTFKGLMVCKDSLVGKASTNTSQLIVDHWVDRMRTGDEIADQKKEFSLPL